MEIHLSRLEGSYEQISERLNDQSRLLERIDAKVDTLRSDMDARFLQMDGKIDQLSHRVYIFGAALWASLVIGLFAIAAGFINSGG